MEVIDQEVYLDGLPAEVLLKIFTFLDIKDLYRCIEVSKRIRSIGLDESLWQKINLNLNQKIPSIFIKDILSKGCKYLSLQHAQLEGKLNLKHHSQLQVRRFQRIIFILVCSPKKNLQNCGTFQYNKVSFHKNYGYPLLIHFLN